MRRAILLLGLLTACSSVADTSSDDAHLSTLFSVYGPATPGQATRAVLHNSTSYDMRIGPPGCHPIFDQLVDGTWFAVPHADGACIAVVYVIPTNDSLSFTFNAPVIPGVYRLHETTGSADPQDLGELELFSREFVVLPAASLTAR